MINNKITSFTDLIAWKRVRALIVEIYRITKKFPKEEFFGLTSQIRRAVISISANLAEGFSRRTNKDKIQFYYVSLGSLSELQNYLIIAYDLGYLNKNTFDDLIKKATEISRLINGLIKSLK